jgi:hypothetical protein
MRRAGGIISAICGAVLSAAGIIGAFSVGCIVSAPICGVVCGGSIALLGIGIAGFLAKYSYLFLLLGGLLFLLGIVLIAQKKGRICCKTSEKGDDTCV